MWFNSCGDFRFILQWKKLQEKKEACFMKVKGYLLWEQVIQGLVTGSWHDVLVVCFAVYNNSLSCKFLFSIHLNKMYFNYNNAIYFIFALKYIWFHIWKSCIREHSNIVIVFIPNCHKTGHGVLGPLPQICLTGKIFNQRKWKQNRMLY